MSLHTKPFTAVPEETARVARAAFPQGNLYIRMRDEIGMMYEDEAFAPLFSPRGQPAEAPWRLALVTIMQYAERHADAFAARVAGVVLVATSAEGTVHTTYGLGPALARLFRRMEQTGASVLDTPQQPGAARNTTTYFDMVDNLVHSLATGLGAQK